MFSKESVYQASCGNVQSCARRRVTRADEERRKRRAWHVLARLFLFHRFQVPASAPAMGANESRTHGGTGGEASVAEESYYELLGVPEDADQDQIKVRSND
jgi:hypothetical protein